MNPKENEIPINKAHGNGGEYINPFSPLFLAVEAQILGEHPPFLFQYKWLKICCHGSSFPMLLFAFSSKRFLPIGGVHNWLESNSDLIHV